MSRVPHFPPQGQRFNPSRHFCSVFVPNVIGENRELTFTAKLVYGRLVQFAGRDGRCFPKYRTIAASLAMSEPTAINAVAQLIELGFLEKQKSPGRSGANLYYFLWHPSFDDAVLIKGEASPNEHLPEQGQRFNPFGLFCGASVPNVICENWKLTPAAKLVYGRLAQFAGKDGRCFPKYETIAVSCGMSKRAAINAVAQLVKLGFLEKQQSPGRTRTNFYHFLWHSSFNDALLASYKNLAPQGNASASLSREKVHPRPKKFAPKETQGRESRKEPPQNTPHQGSPRGGGELSEVQEEYIHLKVDAVDRAGKLRESKAALERTLRSKALEGILDMSDLDELRSRWQAAEQRKAEQQVELNGVLERKKQALIQEKENRKAVQAGILKSGLSVNDWAAWFITEFKKSPFHRERPFGLYFPVALRAFCELYPENIAKKEVA